MVLLRLSAFISILLLFYCVKAAPQNPEEQNLKKNQTSVDSGCEDGLSYLSVGDFNVTTQNFTR